MRSRPLGAESTARAVLSQRVTSRQAANANRSLGRSRLVPVRPCRRQTVIDIDAIITETRRVQTVALGGEILLLRLYACVSHH